MIKAVFNGYWRSGTTLVWRILRESNPELLVFYEPFNKKLPVYLLREGPEGSSPLHNVPLWREYYEAHVIDEVGINHPNLNSVFPETWGDVKLYLKIFHNLSQDCVLQTNRAHFFLRNIERTFSARLIQIVRNPLDVYVSILKHGAIHQKKGIIEKMAHLSYRIFRRGHFFETAPCFRWIRKHFGYPSVWEYKFKITHFRDLLGMFAVCWTISNYFALKSVEDCFFKYEDLLTYPDEVSKKVEECAGVKFRPDVVNIKKSEVRPYKKLRRRFLDKIREYKIMDEFEFIEARLGYFKEGV